MSAGATAQRRKGLDSGHESRQECVEVGLGDPMSTPRVAIGEGTDMAATEQVTVGSGAVSEPCSPFVPRAQFDAGERTCSPGAVLTTAEYAHGNIISRAEPSRAEPSRAEPSRAEPSRAEPSRAEPSRAEPSRAEPSRAEPSRAEPSRAEPSRAEPSRAEPSRAEPSRAERPLRLAPAHCRAGGLTPWPAPQAGSAAPA